MNPKNLHQGIYKLKNPQKYSGNPDNVVYRSSWEKRLMIFFDQHPSVLTWGSEEVIIPYFWEMDGRQHRYFPDFIVQFQTPKGVVKMLIEVKPYVQTIEPKKTPRKREKTLLKEIETYTKNRAKWIAAEAFCKERGWVFRIITEKEIFKEKVW